MQHPASARFSLPLLASGQAQKELFHNEALTLLDFLIHPVVQSVADDPDSLTPDAGQAWIVGPAPTGTWVGKENQIAGWSAGGWRFLSPVEAMQVVIAGTAQQLLFFNGVWQGNSAISNPNAGNNADPEARTSIDSILTALRKVGIIPT